MIGQYFHALNLLVTQLDFLCADMTGPLPKISLPLLILLECILGRNINTPPLASIISGYIYTSVFIQKEWKFLFLSDIIRYVTISLFYNLLNTLILDNDSSITHQGAIFLQQVELFSTWVLLEVK